MISRDEFVEYNCFNNNYYGTSSMELIKFQNSDKVLLYIMKDNYIRNRY